MKEIAGWGEETLEFVFDRTGPGGHRKGFKNKTLQADCQEKPPRWVNHDRSVRAVRDADSG